MSITITTDVFCDICGTWTFGDVGPKPKIQEARQVARQKGWLRCRSPISGEMSDICDNCAKEHSLIKPQEKKTK